MAAEKPPSVCEVEFLDDGTARVTEDETFFAREFPRNTLPEVADALKRVFVPMNGDLKGVVSVMTTVTSDKHILFTVVIKVSSGSVSDTIGNTIFGMAKCRTFLRM